MEYPGGRTCKTIRPSIRSDNAGLAEIRPGPMLGENTVELLQELGMDESAIQDSLRKGVARQHE